jgi:hypothetical protein
MSSTSGKIFLRERGREAGRWEIRRGGKQFITGFLKLDWELIVLSIKNGFAILPTVTM